MKKKIYLIIIAIIGCLFIISCKSNQLKINQSESKGINSKKVLYQALQKYYEHEYDTYGKENLLDTVTIFPKSYMDGYYYLGLKCFNFYFEYIDTSNFKNFSSTKADLYYYRQVQNYLYDTIWLDKEYLNIRDDSIKIIYIDKNDSLGRKPQYQLTPVLERRNGMIEFAFLHDDEFAAVFFNKEEDRLIYDTTIVFDHGSDYGQSTYFHLDTLKTIDFKKLYKEYNMKY